MVLGGGITGTLAATLLTDEGFRNFTVCQRSKPRQDSLRRQLAGFGIEVKSPDELEEDYQKNKDDRSRGFDVILEATGNPEAVEKALSYLKYGGKLVIFGCCPSDAKIEVSPFSIYWKELTIAGSLIQPNTYRRAVEKVISLQRQGRLDLDVLRIGKFHLGEYQIALDKLNSKELSKAIIVPK